MLDCRKDGAPIVAHEVKGEGTCIEWMKAYSGEKAPESDWYVPFSMALKDEIEPKTFPITRRVKNVVDAVTKLVAALI